MSVKVDARGCSCPEPVIRTKNAIKDGPAEAVVLVDNNTAVENVKRFAIKKKYNVSVEEVEDYFQLTLTK